MAKLTLTDGTIFEGTTEEIFAITERFNGTNADKPIDKPADTITHNGVEYTLVDRKAQEGDVVVFTENTSLFMTNGKYYGPAFVGRSAESQIYGDDKDYYNVYNPKFDRKESNVLVYAPKAEALKVGDKVRVLKPGEFGGVYVGQIGEVVNGHAFDFDDKPEYSIKVVGADGDHDYFRPQDLRKATDEEVAEAKALVKKAAKEAVFTQAGRKPNEYRKGDIVRTIHVEGGIRNGHKPGLIGEVTYDTIVFNKKTRNPNVLINGESLLTNVEPVTFVESRLDRN